MYAPPRRRNSGGRSAAVAANHSIGREVLLGASWTLDREIAAGFPFKMRYNFGGQPVLVTAETRKCNILAVKLCREEAEVIVLRGRRILAREPLPEPGDAISQELHIAAGCSV